MASAARSGTSLYGLFKQGWKEIPEVMGSSVYAVVGLVIGGCAVYRYQNSEVKKPFKMTYTVIRDDDPEAEIYKKFAAREHK